MAANVDVKCPNCDNLVTLSPVSSDDGEDQYAEGCDKCGAELTLIVAKIDDDND